MEGKILTIKEALATVAWQKISSSTPESYWRWWRLWDHEWGYETNLISYLPNDGWKREIELWLEKHHVNKLP